MAHDWSGNAAPDGYYVDAYDDTVLPLQTGYGFDKDTFDAAVPTTVYTASALTSTAIQSAINSASAGGGGIVRLPAGAGSISTKLTLASNILLEGAGLGSTVLTWTGTSGSPIFAQDKRNVVVRDLSLNANNQPVYGIDFVACDNVMVERTDVYRTKNGGLHCRFVDGVTFRYNIVRNASKFHGIAIKDIFENGDLVDEAYCNAQFNALNSTHGTVFTQNIALYSNVCSNNPGRGINCHGINGEIAGNYSWTNGQGNKSFDGLNMYIHHNTLEDSGIQGWAVSATISYTGRTVGNLTLCSNRFIDNPVDIAFYDRNAAIGGSWTYTGICVLKNNTFSPGNGTITTQPGSSTIKVCAGSDDASATWSGSYGTADTEYCNNCGTTTVITPTIDCTDALILNGDFSDEDASWSLITDGTVTIDASSGSMVVDITDEGTATELSQATLSVTSAADYEVKVLLSADVAMSVGLELVDNTTPATNRGLDTTISVGTTAAIYSTQFTANATTTNARLRFSFSAPGTVTIEEVCFRAVPSAEIYANFTQNGTGGAAPQTVAFTDLSTADNTITAWSWRINGVEVSTSQNPSYTFYTQGVYDVELTVTSSDGSNTLLKQDLITITSSSSAPTAGSMSLTVPGGSSDCERRSGGFDLSLSGVRISNDGHIGVRFVMDTDIPSGATITSAVLTFAMMGPAPSTYHTVTIRGDDRSNASVFSDSTDFDGRTWTTASQTWTPSTWTIGATVDLPDLSAIVQELVDDNGGLSSGDGIAFRLSGGGASGSLYKLESYETAGTVPALALSWSGSGGGGTAFVNEQTVQISAGANDAERRTGGFDLALAGLRIYQDAGAVAGVGLRFILAEDIPANATIDSATIELWGLGAGSTADSVTIRYEDAASPAAFSDSTDFDARSLSTTNVVWTPSTWPVGQWIETDDISTVIQDLLDNYGPLVAGTPIVLVLKSETAGSGYMKFSSYETSPAQAPKLNITASEPAMYATATIGSSATLAAVASVVYAPSATIAAQSSVSSATGTLAAHPSATIAVALNFGAASLRGPTPLSAQVLAQLGMSALATMAYAASATIGARLEISRASIPTHRASATIAMTSGMSASAYYRIAMAGDGAVAHYRTASSVSTRSTDREKRSGVATKRYRP